MKRRGLSRFLLFGLIAVTVLLLVRLFGGSPDDDSLVFIEDDIKVDQLLHHAFTVEGQSVTVEVSATGSLQSDSVLAAYPWILRRKDRAVVWTLDPMKSERGHGGTVTTTQRVALDPGHYDAFFTSYGDNLRPGSPATSFFDRVSAFIDDDFQRWRNEAGRWKFSVRSLSEEDAHRLVLTAMDEDQDPNNVWDTGPVGSNKVSEFLFEIARPTDIRVRCVGEIYDDFLDAGWIEDIESGSHIWDMTTSKTEPAGGSIRNRSCQTTLTLPVGRFRAVYRSDDQHAHDDWRANPPFDALFWGMRLTAGSDEDARAISPFDPWESLPRIASLSGIGDDQLVSYTFTLDEPMRVMVHAVGEGYPKRGEMFDYAWIVSEGDWDVWKMTFDLTKHAGGSSKNRRAESVIALDANVPYTVYYKTDGSHAYGDWNEDPPLHPDRWGVTIFALDPDFIPSMEMTPPPPSPPVSKPGYEASGDAPIVSLQGIGNGMNVSQPFELADDASLHIYALGEMTRDGRYDWGWISNVETGAVVWEMRREHSVSAGGTSKNRLVDVVVDLPRGSYEAHFTTDDTHAYPDFRYGGAPDNPAAWGMTVQIVEQGGQDQ